MRDDPDRKLKGTEFLERQVYRQRRLLDALRLLPVIGLVLFLVPALIPGSEAGSTATRLIYFFGVWIALIVLCAALVRRRIRQEEG